MLTMLLLAARCRHALVKIQQHNADTEEIALAACEVSQHIQSSTAYLQGTARFGTKLLEDCYKVTRRLALVEQITCIFGVNRANCDTRTKVGIGHLYGH